MTEMGMFGRIFVELAKGSGDADEIMIDATPSQFDLQSSLVKNRGSVNSCPEVTRFRAWFRSELCACEIDLRICTMDHVAPNRGSVLCRC